MRAKIKKKQLEKKMNFKAPNFFDKKTICLLMAFVFFLACQDDVTEIITPSDQEIITQSSNLATLLLNTASLDGSIDDVIDNANCILINLPVNIQINDVELLIDSIDDYAFVETVLDDLNVGYDSVEILFPITITLNNFSEVEIENANQLQLFSAECLGDNENDDDIECVDFQYPITFSIYNATFQVIETTVINNDSTLYNFIENLEGGVLASLDFPITMVFSDGALLVVNNNQELEIAISEAEYVCDEADDNYSNNDNACSVQEIELNLQDCLWNISTYNQTNVFVAYYLSFDANFVFEAYVNNAIAYYGNWSVSQVNGVFGIDFGTTWQELNGFWEIVDCGDGAYELTQETQNQVLTMVLNKDCDQNQNAFNCFQSFDAVLEVCDTNNDGFEVFNLPSVFDNCLNPNVLNVTYHETQFDADISANAIASPETYTNVIVSQQIMFARVELISNALEYQVFEISLLINNCTNNTCSQGYVEAALTECEWQIAFYNGDTGFNIFYIDFIDVQNLVIASTNESYTGNWSTSQNGSDVAVSIYNISGGNVQILNGDYIVIECSTEQIVLQDATNSNNTLVLDKSCN